MLGLKAPESSLESEEAEAGAERPCSAALPSAVVQHGSEGQGAERDKSTESTASAAEAGAMRSVPSCSEATGCMSAVAALVESGEAEADADRPCTVALP